MSHPQLKAINHSLFLAFCPPPAGQMQSRGRFSLVQIEAKSAFNVKLGGKRRRTNGTRCYRGRIGRFWQGFLPFRSASTAFFPDSNLYFAPPSIILPPKKPFLGSQLLRSILIIPPASSIQGSGTLSPTVNSSHRNL